MERFMDYFDVPYNHANVHNDIISGQDMTLNGETIANQHQSIYPGTTDTYAHGQHVASTKPDVNHGVDIIQNGHHTGVIANDVYGHPGLYDTNFNQIANVDPSGNIHWILNHADPLSMSDQVNLQQLKFAIENNQSL